MVPEAMDEWANSARIEELARLLAHHSNLYYNEAFPEITDAEYDALFDELQQLHLNTHNFPKSVRIQSLAQRKSTTYFQ